MNATISSSISLDLELQFTSFSNKFWESCRILQVFGNGNDAMLLKGRWDGTQEDEIV